MMKRILSLLTALVLLMSMTALGEEQVYDLIENALYRIVLRTEAGDQTLGTGVLFSDKQLLLTSAACVQEGEIIAIGPEGECAVSAVQVLDQSGAAMMELSAPASGTPLHLAADNAAGMAALFGTAADGEFLVAPLNQVRATIFRGQSALLLNSSEGLLPGSFLTDEHGNLIGLCIAQQAEGNYAVLVVGTAILVPTAEELLHRGLVFGSLYSRNPYIAYIFSATLFSSIHILGYIMVYPIHHLLLAFLQYLPAGLVLAWAYHKSGSIFSPILIHAAVNALALLSLR